MKTFYYKLLCCELDLGIQYYIYFHRIVLYYEPVSFILCCRCNFLNFAKNIRCLECKEDGPRKVDMGDVEMKKGDWICSE